jgi:hypothetical protein
MFYKLRSAIEQYKGNNIGTSWYLATALAQKVPLTGPLQLVNYE